MKTREQVKNDIIEELKSRAITEDLKDYTKQIIWNYFEDETDTSYIDYYIDKVLKEESDIWDVTTEMIRKEIISDWSISDLSYRIYDNLLTDFDELIQEQLFCYNIESYVSDYIENNYERIIDEYVDGSYKSIQNDGQIWYDGVEYEALDYIKEKLENIEDIEWDR